MIKIRVILIIALGALMSWWSYSIGVEVFSLLNLFFFVVSFYLLMSAIDSYVIKYSKNMEDIVEVIIRKKNKPMFSFAISLAKKQYDDAEYFLNELEEMDWNPKSMSAFWTLFYLEQGHFSLAKRHLKTMQKDELYYYYSGQIAVEEGEWTYFEQFKQNIHSKWMLYALEAKKAFKKNNAIQYKNLIEAAVFHAKGFDRFILVNSISHTVKR